jgi:hypothetical protein
MFLNYFLPPLLPTPATDPVVNSQPEPEKVNADVYEFMNVESDSEDQASQNTQSTIYTVYSKFGIREGYNYSDAEHDPESDRLPMSSQYHQCKTARVASMTQMCTSVEVGKDIGTEKQIGFNPVGSFNCIGDTEILRTFRGSRLTSNDTDVNQNISLSFDPATLVCVVCEKPHPILQTGEGGAPPIIVITDQNFMPTLSGGGGGSCVSIIRLENCSLDELTELTCEIFERCSVPAGSLFLLKSTSHLNSVGSSIYAIDWCSAIAKLNSRIGNAKILPLTPVIREDGPGSVARQLIEISAWYKRVYDKNTLGLLPVWAKLLEILGQSDEDGLDLGFTDITQLLSCTLSLLAPYSYPRNSSLAPATQPSEVFTVRRLTS